ncbi:MAG: hypothetical protein J0L56_08155 [Chitinophagales bacterium]|nr:hypothetical protein [Chitinophagales bacterium]
MKGFFFAVPIIVSLFNVQAQNKQYDIFSYKVPAGFTLKEESNSLLYYMKSEGKNYCQLILYPATAGEDDVDKDFQKHWDLFARKPEENVNDPETKDTATFNGWKTLKGAARGKFNKQLYTLTVTTFSKNGITYYIAAVLTNPKYIPAVQEFVASVVPDESKFVRNGNNNNQPVDQSNTDTNGTTGTTIIATASSTITKSVTTFNDGWTARITNDYVKLTKAGTELRLHYIDKALDDARPNTIDAPEYYWSKYVEPYFNISNLQKWSGVQYPVIYHMQGDAVEKETGKQYYVAIKIVYSGGARPIVVIAPDQNSYQQQFPHPNDIDPYLNANKFAVSLSDIIGTWKGSGGGGVEYYNVYSGSYAGMSAVSSTDEFTFNSNGTYSSTPTAVPA